MDLAEVVIAKSLITYYQIHRPHVCQPGREKSYLK